MTVKKIAGTSFVLEGVACLTFDRFKELYRGKIKSDLSRVWDTLQIECHKAGLIEKTEFKEKRKRRNKA